MLLFVSRKAGINEFIWKFFPIPAENRISALSPLSCSYSFFLARLIAVASTVNTCLVCNSSIVATCPSIPAARFAFRLFCSFCFSCS